MRMRIIYTICVEIDILFMHYDTQSCNALFSILSTNAIGKSQRAMATALQIAEYTLFIKIELQGFGSLHSFRWMHK